MHSCETSHESEVVSSELSDNRANLYRTWVLPLLDSSTRHWAASKMSQVAAVWMGLGLIIVWSLGKCCFIPIVQIRQLAPDGVGSNGDSQD